MLPLTLPSSSKLSLSVRDTENKDGNKIDSPRSYANRRFGDSKSNPFNPVSTSATKSPSVGASSAFGLGSGAFASFGSAKTPKTPGSGNAFDLSTKDKKEKEPAEDKSEVEDSSEPSIGQSINPSDHPLRNSWTLYYRPPANKFSDYEKSTTKIATLATVESFWTIYTHLKPPSELPTVSDYHVFKDGIRPVWEDDANKKGGKWIVRLKKGVADRYWEDLLLAIVGDQFMEAGDEVCGAVLSVRSGEDVLSVWTKIDGGRNIKIRYGMTSIFTSVTDSFPEKQSSASLPFHLTRIFCGRAMMTALLKGLHLTKHGSRNPAIQVFLELRSGVKHCTMIRRDRRARALHDIAFNSMRICSTTVYCSGYAISYSKFNSRNSLSESVECWLNFGGCVTEQIATSEKVRNQKQVRLTFRGKSSRSYHDY